MTSPRFLYQNPTEHDEGEGWVLKTRGVLIKRCHKEQKINSQKVSSSMAESYLPDIFGCWMDLFENVLFYL